MIPMLFSWVDAHWENAKGTWLKYRYGGESVSFPQAGSPPKPFFLMQVPESKSLPYPVQKSQWGKARPFFFFDWSGWLSVSGRVSGE